MQATTHLRANPLFSLLLLFLFSDLKLIWIQCNLSVSSRPHSMCEITLLLNVNGLFILTAEMWKYYESHIYSQILVCPRSSRIQKVRTVILTVTELRITCK